MVDDMNQNRDLEKSDEGEPVLIPVGDMSDDSLKNWLEYGHEDERLDYKEHLEFEKERARGSKVELVRDLVSIGNTHGGYVIVGVKDEKNGKFTQVGTTEDVLRLYTSENIGNWMSSYVDGQPEIHVKPACFYKRDYLFIFIKKSNVPLVFRKDGTYRDSDGKECVNFRSGDIYVRHGSKSERAMHQDIGKLLLQVREDERRAVFAAKQRHQDVLDRLDSMVELMGGTSTGPEALDLAVSSTAVIEERLAKQIATGRSKYSIWLLNREFKRTKQVLRGVSPDESGEDIEVLLDREYVAFLKGLLPVWKVALELDEIGLSAAVAASLFDLYDYVDDKSFNISSARDSLWLKGWILYLAYCLGAYAVEKDAANYARLLLPKETRPEGAARSHSWIRATSIELSRAGRSKFKTICRDVFEHFQTDLYVTELFENEEVFTIKLCQFDLLQCMYTIVAGDGNCFPSFGAYTKMYIDEMVEKIVRNRHEDLWLPQVDDDVLAQALRTLDERANTQFFSHWTGGCWNSSVVREFMTEHPPHIE